MLVNNENYASSSMHLNLNNLQGYHKGLNINIANNSQVSEFLRVTNRKKSLNSFSKQKPSKVL